MFNWTEVHHSHEPRLSRAVGTYGSSLSPGIFLEYQKPSGSARPEARRDADAEQLLLELFFGCLPVGDLILNLVGARNIPGSRAYSPQAIRWYRFLRAPTSSGLEGKVIVQTLRSSPAHQPGGRITVTVTVTVVRCWSSGCYGPLGGGHFVACDSSVSP